MRYVPPENKKSVQAKLKMGQPNDHLEQEADRVANRVVQNPQSDSLIQRKCDQCEEEEVQMKGKGSGSLDENNLESGLQNNQGGGTAMDKNTLQMMERGIGADFSNVKIHTNQEAVQMNQQLHARAFTNGQDIYFNRGEYQPNSSQGKHLLAHELTHVVQQNGKSESIQKKQSRRDTYPWTGEIITTWSAAMRNSPSKDEENPHANTVADLPRRHPVEVLSKTDGWLRVKTQVDGAEKTGYVSQELVGLTSEASSHLSQTITDGPSPAYNRTFGWDSKFRLIFSYDKKSLTVRVSLFSSATKAQKAVWKSAIEGKWSNQKKLEVVQDATKPDKKDTYKIKFEILWVDDAADAHYTINANPATTTGGTAGVGGTTSMTDWGINDRVDVPHEFGHMMGNKDEYFTVDGTAYGAHRQTGKGIMNNPAENPMAKHFDLIKSKAATALNLPLAQCTII